jgi:hypothetical protein
VAAHLPWLGIDVDLPDHRKSIRLGHIIKEPNAWAYVLKVWFWCSKHAQDGRIDPEGAADVIEEASGWKGPRGKLFKAMVAVGWMDQREDGSVEVHDWEEHALPHIERRVKEAERGRVRRAELAKNRKSAKSFKTSARVQRTSSGRPVGDGDRDRDHDLDQSQRVLQHEPRSSSPPTPQPPMRRNGTHALAIVPELDGQGGVEEKRVELRVVPDPEPTPTETQAPEDPATTAWLQVLEQIREDGKRYAMTWLERLNVPRLKGRTLRIAAHDRFFLDWVVVHYQEILDEAVQKQGLDRVELYVDESITAIPEARPPRFTDEDWWREHNKLRVAAGLAREKLADRPENFGEWLAQLERDRGVTAERLLAAYERWLECKAGRWAEFGWPIKTFMAEKVWFSRVRG